MDRRGARKNNKKTLIQIPPKLCGTFGETRYHRLDNSDSSNRWIRLSNNNKVSRALTFLHNIRWVYNGRDYTADYNAFLHYGRWLCESLRYTAVITKLYLNETQKNNV